MKSFLVSFLAALVLCGCVTGPAVSKNTTGNLEINIFAPEGLSVSYAQLYVDGVFVGNASKTKPILYLRRGVRTIRVELPGTKAYERTIDILGDPNHQVLNVTLEEL